MSSLVLSRKLGEKVIIMDGLITVTVEELSSHRVRLAFTCPKEVDVNREEIYLLKKSPLAPTRRIQDAAGPSVPPAHPDRPSPTRGESVGSADE